MLAWFIDLWRQPVLASDGSSGYPIAGGGTVDDAIEFLRAGSLGRAMLAGADPATQARAVASVRAALAPYADDDGGVHLGAAVWLVRAGL